MLKERDIPISWRTKLNEIQETFPDAVIAGGCLRDLYHGVEFKDIDIFVPNADKPDIQQALDEYRKDHSFCVTRNIKAKKDYQQWAAVSQEIENVFTMKIGNLSIDVIGTSVSPDKVIERFDYGICQIQYDGFNVRHSDWFKHDVMNQKFTLIRCDKQEDWDRAMKRYQKLLLKYPGYELDASRFDDLYSTDIKAMELI